LVNTSIANQIHCLLPLSLTNDHISSHWIISWPFFFTLLLLVFWRLPTFC
jgi:hypothetical protein